MLYYIQQFICTFNNNNNNNNNGDHHNDNENENDDDSDNETIAQNFYGQYLQYICCPFRKF